MKSTATRMLARMLLLATLAIMLVGCPQAAPPVHGDAATQVPPPVPSTPQSVIGHKPAPRMGGPLPAQVVPEPVKIDNTCSADSDCAVKNVGSCCGALPACVNKRSPTDPAAVRAQCAKQGRMSSCGYHQVTHCACRQGRCASTEATPVGGWIDDPPLPPDPVR